MTPVVAALISALAVLVAALVTALVGPAWKSRHDRKRATQDVVDRYSRPLLQVAFELQSRLYNVARFGFFTNAWSGTDEYRRRYAETSTLWLFGQYLGWIEILRREVQFLDFGDITLTRELRERLLAVRDELASERYSDRLLQIYRSDQRAIGERMILRRESRNRGHEKRLPWLRRVQRRTQQAVVRELVRTSAPKHPANRKIGSARAAHLRPAGSDRPCRPSRR